MTRSSGVAEKKSSGVAEKRDRVAKKTFKFEIYLKRRRFGSPRTGPVLYPTRPVPKLYRFFFFFWPKMGTHAAVPRQYTYPRRTQYRYGKMPVLPSLKPSPVHGHLWNFLTSQWRHLRGGYITIISSFKPFLQSNAIR